MDRREREGAYSTKDVYKKGEPVRFWLSVKNERAYARDLELRHPNDDESWFTYITWVLADEGTPWGSEYYDTRSWRIGPGETVRILEGDPCTEWDQTDLLGMQVPAQYYSLVILFDGLYADGQLVGKVVEDQVSAQLQFYKKILIEE